MANTVLVNEDTLDNLTDYSETIQSHTDPKDPNALKKLLRSLGDQLLSSPNVAVSEPHYLALALTGQIKFSKNHPRIHLLEDLKNVTWPDMKNYIETTTLGRKICDFFENFSESTLLEAVTIIFLSEQKNVEFLPSED